MYRFLFVPANHSPSTRSPHWHSIPLSTGIASIGFCPHRAKSIPRGGPLSTLSQQESTRMEESV